MMEATYEDAHDIGTARAVQAGVYEAVRSHRVLCPANGLGLLLSVLILARELILFKCVSELAGSLSNWIVY
jgi:hypothetical protein